MEPQSRDNSPVGFSSPEKRVEKATATPYLRVAVLSLLSALGAAMLGFVVSFAEDQRKRQLDFVDAQLEHLYGPLFAEAAANANAWQALRAKMKLDRVYYFGGDQAPSVEQVNAWRRWMKNVFMPGNEKMASAIVNNAHLIRGQSLYPVF